MYRSILYYACRASNTLNCFFYGMYSIKWRYHKISDHLADYEPYEKVPRPATAVICNHKSFFDFFLLLAFKEAPCFVAKSAFRHYP
jgi:1-acyl-sn-glycerol-3-phosphate acyltransferase